MTKWDFPKNVSLVQHRKMNQWDLSHQKRKRAKGTCVYLMNAGRIFWQNLRRTCDFDNNFH